ncbi:hypothetical protein IKE_05831 [Bacillus cereus VD196]|uniref:NADP-dependent oxidoreductase domain-containing protein n=1 Tax=Bacillus cereus VD196 TaxID=1053243 RepID=A0A9W5PYH6_BACCE|nr:aldo/keto reductase [Bacillus cereus]EOO61929.1 hypothetical protein IKE_05831 [Bacillus cereus VD196]
MRYNPLGHTNLLVSKIGFGCSPLGGVFGTIEEKSAIHSVHKALELGITYFDVAPYYGSTKAELVLGKALMGIPRDQFVLSTKVGRYGDQVFDFSASRVYKSIDESLKRLRVTELDVVFIHDIEFGNFEQILNETIPVLQSLKKAGIIKAIGASGLPISILRRIVELGNIDLILSYCQYTLFNKTLIHHLQWFDEQGVGVINASPFAMGLLTKTGPPSWHPASPIIRETCKRIVENSQNRGIDIAHLALHFATRSQGIATTLVGMNSEEQVRQNINWLNQSVEFETEAWVQSCFAPIQDQIWSSSIPRNT